MPSKLNLHAGAFCLSPSKENGGVTPTLILSGSGAAHPWEQHHIIMWGPFPTGACDGVQVGGEHQSRCL